MSAKLQISRRVPIRTIEVVIDLEDAFNPEISLEDFIREKKVKPEPPRYRVITLEVAGCTEDHQPVLVTECGRCRRFIRRYEGEIYCRKYLT